MESTSKKQLSIAAKLGYGSGELGATLMWSTLAFLLLNFLTDQVGLAAALAGVALMVGKILDAVSDVYVGYLSDKTRTRWGRRRPWFFFGSVPLGLAFVLMFTNPGWQGEIPLFIWAVVAYNILCTAFTIVNIPYIAMVPELTKDFHERTNVNAYRSIFSVIGTLLGAGVALPIILIFNDKNTGYMVMAAIFGGVMIISALIPFFSTKEPPLPDKVEKRSLFSSYAVAIKNKSYLAVVIPWALNTAGITIATATLIYYFKYVFGDEKLLSVALLALLVTAMIFLPVSVAVSKKLGKRNTYIFGMLITAMALITLFFIGHLFSVYVVYACMFFAGIGLSTHFVMPWSMLPDVVEYDYSIHGLRRDGLFYGVWNFMSKIGAALAGIVTGSILALFGYLPNVAQTEVSMLGIRILIGPAAALFFILAGIILAFYPIDQARYESIMDRIKTMEGEKSA